MATAAVGFITEGFPAPGLRRTQRLITGNGEDGKGHFLATDAGDHHRVMGEGQAVAVIPYSTKGNPVDLNGNADVNFAMENEVREVAPTKLLSKRLRIITRPEDQDTKQNPRPPGSQYDLLMLYFEHTARPAH